MISLDPIGKVTHYYDKLSVAIVDLENGDLKVGDQLKFKRGEEEFSQAVESLQIDHQSVTEVKKGDSFGMKVDKPTKPGTLVYLA
ncbi:hypothetical protein HYS93_03635 [Candidatus Daviesbacteria bacterium]|nr:hypothetical protein [Candidatus Daviesbacteria bacterium]